MKQKLLNSIRLRVCMLVAILCTAFAGQAWATEVTFTFGKTNRDVNSTSAVTKSGVTVTVSQNGAANLPNFTSDASDVRFQSGNKMAVSCSGNNTITSIVISYTTAAYAAKITQSSFNTGTYSYTANATTGTWRGAASSIEIVNTASSQTRISQIVVTYAPTTHTLTYSATKGSIAGVDAGSNAVASGADVAETTTVTLTATPSDGYRFSSWSVEGTGSTLSSTSTNPTTFTMGTADATVTANFVEAGDYISASPTTTNIATAGDVAEFTISTDQTLDEDPTKFYTTADGDVTTTKPTWITEVLYDEGTLLLSVEANPGAARTAYFRVEKGSVKSDVITINQAAYVAVTSVALDITSKSLLVENTVTLNATVSPDNATNKNVTWESDDESVATVDEDGVVTAVAAGMATITVKSVADNTKKATCTITVTDGSIDLRTTGEITFGGPFTGAEIGSGGYKSQNCELNGSDENTYTWAEINGYFNDGGWQIKNSTGKVTSPVIKSEYGFTISTTKGTNNVTISDGTTSGQNSLTTSKTSTTITIVGDGAYAVFTKITITPLKAPVATGVVVTDPGTLAAGDAGTFAYTAATEEDNTASWTSATPSVITISDAATGAYTAAGRGTSKITLTLTPDDAATYDAVTAQRTITVTAPVVVTASDVAMTYGDAAKAIGATTSTGYEGTLTYTSGNTSIATVDASGNVTAVAVGTTTITISAPADAENYYTAGEDVVIDVTVSAPAGVTTAKTTTPATVVSQTLLSSSLPANWTGDGEIWSGDNYYGAVATNGVDGSTYDLKTESINLNGNYSAASVTFQHTGNKTFSTPSNACKLYVKDGETETPLTINTYFAGDDWKYVSNTSDLSAYIGKSIQLIFRYTPVSGDNGKWEVKNFSVSATPSPTESVTLNASGYATFCSLYPLDFTDYATAGYSAWEVTNIAKSAEVYTVTFNHLTGTIKGGQGILLKGTAGEKVTINSCNSDNKLDENLLIGTTAPTFVASNEYFGLSGSNFVKVNEGVVPAGKALLDADDIPDFGSVKSFIFVFNDDATGITETRTATREEVEAIFNLGGQRMSKMQRGVNIVNGKKVLVK